MTDSPDASLLIDSVRDRATISGSTHTYYRYPARFSPRFAEAAIGLLTKPGEIVYDPFMGGGTTLVEAMRMHRKSVGTDLNRLAVFVSKVKTTPIADSDIAAIRDWVARAERGIMVTSRHSRPLDWISQGYQRNINNRHTWPIRKTIELALAGVAELKNDKQQAFARCLILRTAQWAFDCRKRSPTARAFRKQLSIHSEEMIAGALGLRREVDQAESPRDTSSDLSPVCLHLSARDIAGPGNYPFDTPPRLILTSPPYPGVHVLYHRWQVHGRRETPAPYWIAGCHDGNGASYYTFGDRKQRRLKDYFENMRESYLALSEVADEGTWLVQLVAFSSPRWQLPRFLQVLRECGFSEVRLGGLPQLNYLRAWRTVPNRKFYADGRGATPSSREVLLVHKRSPRIVAS